MLAVHVDQVRGAVARRVELPLVVHPGRVAGSIDGHRVAPLRRQAVLGKEDVGQVARPRARGIDRLHRGRREDEEGRAGGRSLHGSAHLQCVIGCGVRAQESGGAVAQHRAESGCELIGGVGRRLRVTEHGRADDGQVELAGPRQLGGAVILPGRGVDRGSGSLPVLRSVVEDRGGQAAEVAGEERSVARRVRLAAHAL